MIKNKQAWLKGVCSNSSWRFSPQATPGLNLSFYVLNQYIESEEISPLPLGVRPLPA